jgi:methyltransferase-like protein/SAM-dependent methyltransferase
MENSSTSYDKIPYRSMPFVQSHPNRLATVATLLGLSPKPIDACRVLELGCAAGGNLLPMADQFPNSTFVGIDASSRQIADGKKVIVNMGLKNIELQHQNILDFEGNVGKFDFVISHGVYSWVADDVQQKMLDLCGQVLSPGGVAYISYNTYPGWHMRGMIRDIMRYRAKSFNEPAHRLAQARSLLTFFNNSVRGENDPFAMLLKQEVETISRSEDFYLHHEHLEENNAPIYFYQFVERARASGLQYLGEADFSTTLLGNFPESVQIMLQSVSRDEIELEQYMDFLRNRGFRQTLLCRSEERIDRSGVSSKLARLAIASSVAPEGEQVDLHSTDQTVYVRRKASLSTNNPMLRAAFRELRARWPIPIPFPELASIAKSVVSGQPAAVDATMPGSQGEQLAESMLRCFESSLVDLHIGPTTYTVRLSERPNASAYARHQAISSPQVTNRRHETVMLDDLQRQILIALDGTRTTDQIIELVTELVVSGKLVIHHQQRRIVDAAEVRAIIADNISGFIQNLANMSLLVG